MRELIAKQSLARLCLLIIFTLTLGSLLRDHAGLPVGKVSRPWLVGQPVYEGINHLAHEESPFLVLGADQPIWWFTWNQDAFALARMLERQNMGKWPERSVMPRDHRRQFPIPLR